MLSWASNLLPRADTATLNNKPLVYRLGDTAKPFNTFKRIHRSKTPDFFFVIKFHKVRDLKINIYEKSNFLSAVPVLL